MNRKHFLSNRTRHAMTALVASACLLGLSTASQAEELLFSIIGAPKHVANAVMYPEWAENVEKATNGEVTIKILLKPVAPPPRLYDATTEGLTDSAVIMNAFIQQQAPLIQISMLPFMFNDANAHAVAMWRTYDKFFKDADEFKDVQLLGFVSGMGGQICSLKEPINSLETLQSYKLWSLPGGSAKTLSALDVAVVPGPAVRMYPIVSKGTVDGWASLPIADAYTFSIDDVTKSCTYVEGGLGQATFSLVMNKDVWNGLSPEVQEQIMSVSGEQLARTSKHWQDLAESQQEKFSTTPGKSVIEADPAFWQALRDAAQPQHDEWIAQANALGIDGQAAFDYFVEQSKLVHEERSQ